MAIPLVPLAGKISTGVTNPYGRSKLMVEEILRDLAKSDPRWAIVLLRYQPGRCP